jgi:hypothetical protein
LPSCPSGWQDKKEKEIATTGVPGTETGSANTAGPTSRNYPKGKPFCSDFLSSLLNFAVPDHATGRQAFLQLEPVGCGGGQAETEGRLWRSCHRVHAEQKDSKSDLHVLCA